MQKLVLPLFLSIAALVTPSDAAEVTSGIDNFRKPLAHYYNDVGGNRGVIGNADFDHNATGVFRATSIRTDGQGFGYFEGIRGNLQSKRDFNPGAIYGDPLKAGVQPRLKRISMSVSLSSPSGNQAARYVLELKGWNGSEQPVRATTTLPHTSLLPGGMITWDLTTTTFTGDVSILTVQALDTKAGDVVTFTPAMLVMDDPNTGNTKLFLQHYGRLLAQYNPATGMVDEFAHYKSGDFESVPATGKLALVTAQSMLLNLTEPGKGEAVIQRTTEALLNQVIVLHGGLLPHFTRQGGTIPASPSIEASTVDTSIAILDALLANLIIGDPNGYVAALKARLQNISWNDLRSGSGYYSHGYQGSSLIPYYWTGWGAETMVVNLAARIGGGQPGNMQAPPSAGAGFITHMAFPIRGSGVDRFGTNWTTERNRELQAQLNWFQPGSNYANARMVERLLYGISACDKPDGSGYEAYGIGPFSVLTDRTISAHYAAMCASDAPAESAAMFDSLAAMNLVSPVSSVESLSVDPDTGAMIVNPLISAWNLCLSAQGFAVAHAGLEQQVKTVMLADPDLAMAWGELFPSEAQRSWHTVDLPEGQTSLSVAVSGDKLMIAGTRSNEPRVWISELTDNGPEPVQELTFSTASLTPAYYINWGKIINQIAVIPGVTPRFLAATSGGVMEFTPDAGAANAMTTVWYWAWDPTYRIAYGATPGKVTFAVANFGTNSGNWEGMPPGPFARANPQFADVRGFIGSNPVAILGPNSHTLPPSTTVLPYESMSASGTQLHTNISQGFTTAAAIIVSASNEPSLLIKRGTTQFNRVTFPDRIVSYSFDDGTGILAAVVSSKAQVLVGKLPLPQVQAATTAGDALTFHGSIQTYGEALSYAFEWRHLGSAVTTTAFQPLAAGLTNPVDVSVTPSGLPPGQAIEFRLLTSSTTGEMRSDWTAAVVPALPPLIAGSGYAPPQATGIGVAATIDSRQLATAVSLEWGTSLSYGNSTTAVNIPGSSTPQTVELALTGLTPGTAYVARIVATNSAGSVQGLPMFFTTPALPPEIVTPPAASTLLVAGSPLQLSVSATGTGLNYLWRKGGESLGMTSATLNLAAVSLNDAGSYTVDVSNVDGVTVSSTPANVVVVAATSAATVNVPRWGSHTLSVSLAGSGASLQWFKNGNALTGKTGSTLLLTNLSAADAAPYFCRVTLGAQQTQTATTTLALITPQLQITVPVMNWQVGKVVDAQFTTTHPVKKWVVSGLPTGLLLNATTGVISGRPTTAKSYKLTVSVTTQENLAATTQATAVVSPLPATVGGNFAGVVSRHSALVPLGGYVTFTVSTTAQASGKLILEGTALPFSAPVVVAANGSGSLQFTFAKQSLALDVILDGAGGPHTAKLSRSYAPEVAVTFPLERQSALLAAQTGRFIYALSPEAAVIGNNSFPQGHGYVVLDAVTAGTAKATLHLADGTTLTHSSIVGGTGLVPVQAMGHTNTASINGSFALQGASLPFEWAKKSQPAASTTRSYKSGIPLHQLTVSGGRYTAPAKNQFLFGVTADTLGNAQASFNQLLITAITQTFRLPATNLPVMPASNPAAVKISIASATGLVTGSFNVTTPKQTVTYRAALIPGTHLALGHFQVAHPLSTSPQYSGAVTIGKTVP